MNDELRYVFHLRHRCGIAAAGKRSDRGEDLWITRCKVPGPASSHRMAGKIDAVRIDLVLLLHQIQDVHYILFTELKFWKFFRRSNCRDAAVSAVHSISQRCRNDVAALF